MGLETGSNVAIAFAFVIAAGLSTTIGAAFAFCARIADKRMLAVSLGVSAGVMLYVSFAEIFLIKAVEGFSDYLCPPDEQEEGLVCSDDTGDKAVRYATLSFFGGIFLTVIMNGFVNLLIHKFGGQQCDKTETFSDDSAQKYTTGGKDRKGSGSDVECGCPPRCGDPTEPEVAAKVDEILEADHHAYHLQRVGLISGLAIALHNFPEGLATFVGTLADPAAGAAIAIAIALHNIPEGIVVAMPVYYATKSRTKAFLWAFLSGVSEPIGGLLGWVVLSNMGDLVYAMMFAIVAGMMVYISVSELIPTALRFDPENKYVTKSVFAGMIIMAASLLLFAI